MEGSIWSRFGVDFGHLRSLQSGASTALSPCPGPWYRLCPPTIVPPHNLGDLGRSQGLSERGSGDARVLRGGAPIRPGSRDISPSSWAVVRGCSMLAPPPDPKMGPRGWVWVTQVLLAQNLGGLAHFWEKGRFWSSGPWYPQIPPPLFWVCPTEFGLKLGARRVSGASGVRKTVPLDSGIKKRCRGAPRSV